jgi:hypothetical protein
MFKSALLTIMLTLSLSLMWQSGKAQTYHVLTGYIMSTENVPVPYAHIRSRGEMSGVLSDGKGKYEMRLLDGYHQLIVKAVGFEEKMVDVTIKENAVKNIYLKPSTEAIQAVTVGRKKVNIAKKVLRSAIAAKTQFVPDFDTYQASCYIKGNQKIEVRKKKKEVIDSSDERSRWSVFEADISFYKNKSGEVKEIRNAVSKKGSTRDLFFQSNTEGNFDFYPNTVMIRSLSPNVYISPLSSNALVTYKVNLEKSYMKDGKKIYEINLAPRQFSNAAFTGKIWIEDETFKVVRLKLTFPKQTLPEYLDFTVDQQFSEINGKQYVSIQTFTYYTKTKDYLYRGETVAEYREIELNVDFPKKWFTNELSRTEQSAYEKDSLFWDSIRPQPLAQDEIAAIEYRDSIYEAHNKKEFLDSVDADFNKITLLKLMWDGQGFINREKKRTIEFAPVLGLFDPVMLGGYRARFFMQYYKKYENRKSLTMVPFISYGFGNNDLKGQLFVQRLYNPMKRGVIGVDFGRQFELINPNDAWINLFKPENFFEKDYIRLIHNRELVNGLHWHSRVRFESRRSLQNFDFDFLEEVFDSSAALRFNTHNALVGSMWLSYTPKQLYVTEPNEKIILGSRYPTFTAMWRGGIPSVLNSILNYNYLEFRVNQSITMNVAGESTYSLQTGKFLTNKKSQFADYKYQRMGDPFLFSNPLRTYQLLPETFTTFDWYLEGHYYHKFNGFLTSKVPLLNKTGIQTVGGAGFLSAPEKDRLHTELFVGADRVFRIGRERFRFGIYYAVGATNGIGVTRGFKFSLEYFDRNANTWNF